MKRISAYLVLASLMSLLFWTTCQNSARKTPSFVKVKGNVFLRDEKPYRYLGANYWQGMNLGSAGIGGDRERLKRELDQMQGLGITNLRILALSEGPDGTPYRIHPAVQREPTVLDEDLLKGLDFLLDEMGKRNMTAVIVLNNFWPWSGGMGQYLHWNGADSIPYPPPHPNGDWDRYQQFIANFYTVPSAVAQNKTSIQKIIERTNSVNQKKYKEDPVIMSWQLCNEPRGMKQVEAFHAWIDDLSGFIKKLDPNHLVSTGSEGYTPWPEANGTDFMRIHAGKDVDYTTAHCWIQNWMWYDPQKHDSTYPSGKSKMLEYLARHVTDAQKLNKPFVLEEFGIMKDEGNFDPMATNKNRDQFYADVFEAMAGYAQKGVASGVNFWAWGGEGRPRIPGTMWRTGDPLTGDPPHEPQGWYSVYNTDSSTHAVIRKYAALMGAK
jgi:mannan endo-1,4-beta-mannosidase